MDRDNYTLLAAFSTVLPLEGPATTPPCVSPVVEEGTQSREEPVVPADRDADDELITGAGGAYL
jgi:hypothetical protein